MYKSLASRPGLQPHAVPSATRTAPLSAPVCLALGPGSQTHRQHRLLLQPAQAVKAVDLDDPDELATGHKVKPERLAAKAVSSKDLLYECSTWREVGSLVAESQDKLTRDKSYGVRVAMRLADIILGNVVDLDDLVSLNGISEAEKMGSAARTASKSGTVKPSSATPLKGVERQRALKLLDSVLLMTLGNLDKMWSSDIAKLLNMLARLDHPQPNATKAILLYFQTFPKRFKVAELFGALAALSSMRLKVNPTTLGVIMEQAVRGLKYVTHEDLANALAALHKVPRGTVNGSVVVAVVGSCKKALLDLGPESLAHLTAFMARQGYKPHPRFMDQLRGILAERLPGLKDPSAAVALLLGLSSMGQPMHGQGDVLEVVQDMLVGSNPRRRPIDSLSPSELAVLGTVLVSCAEAAAAEQLELGLQPSPTLKSPPAFVKAYISCAKKSMDRLDEQSAVGVLLGMSAIAVPGKVASGLAPPLGLTLQLLALMESSLESQPPVQLKRLAAAIAQLVPGAAAAPPLEEQEAEEEDEDEDAASPIEPFFVHKFRVALAKSLVAAPSFAAINVCTMAASECSLLSPPPKPMDTCPKGAVLAAAMADAAQAQSRADEPPGEVPATATKGRKTKAMKAAEEAEVAEAKAQAEAAVVAAEKAADQAAEGAAVESAAGFAGVAARRARALANMDMGSLDFVAPQPTAAPSEAELDQLVEALGRLQGVDVQALTLPEPAPALRSWEDPQGFDESRDFVGSPMGDKSFLDQAWGGRHGPPPSRWQGGSDVDFDDGGDFGYAGGQGWEADGGRSQVQQPRRASSSSSRPDRRRDGWGNTFGGSVGGYMDQGLGDVDMGFDGAGFGGDSLDNWEEDEYAGGGGESMGGHIPSSRGNARGAQPQRRSFGGDSLDNWEEDEFAGGGGEPKGGYIPSSRGKARGAQPQRRSFVEDFFGEEEGSQGGVTSVRGGPNRGGDLGGYLGEVGDGEAMMAGGPDEDVWGLNDFGNARGLNDSGNTKVLDDFGMGVEQAGGYGRGAGGRGTRSNGRAGRAARPAGGRSSRGPRRDANWSGEAAVTGDLDFSDLDFDDEFAR